MTKNRKFISICIPCYNEEENIIPAYKTIKLIADKISHFRYEFIFIDNGSTDQTKNLIKKIARQDKRVVGVFLSRNFGPEGSGRAAFDLAGGDATIIIPCDLQDPPELIPEFIKKWQTGYEIVLGAYTNSVDTPIMTWMRKAFYRIFKTISNIEVPINTTGFGIIDRKVLNVLKSLPETYRFTRGLTAWVGFKKAFIPYRRRKRLKGKSSYNFFSYLQYSERGVFGFSYLPLDFIIYLGFILVFLSFLTILIYFFLFLLFGNPIKGSVTIFVSVMFFGGIQLLAISIIGKYIQVIVEETKARPNYIIDETINAKKI